MPSTPYIITPKRELFKYENFTIGSGVIESGCKTVIGQRFKQSGMIWSLNGSKALLALRALYKSNRTTFVFFVAKPHQPCIKISLHPRDFSRYFRAVFKRNRGGAAAAKMPRSRTRERKRRWSANGTMVIRQQRTSDTGIEIQTAREWSFIK